MCTSTFIHSVSNHHEYYMCICNRILGVMFRQIQWQTYILHTIDRLTGFTRCGTIHGNGQARYVTIYHYDHDCQNMNIVKMKPPVV